MTTKQTINAVPREQLESFAAYVADSPNAIMRARAKELRALLDAPAKLPLIDTHNERLIASLRNRVNELEAAQSQGEPVAKSQRDVPSNPVLGYADSYRAMARQGVKTVSIWSVITDLERNIAPLYAEQPAQAVIDLGAKEVGNYGSRYDTPDVRRAYTYKHQPGNQGAARLGNAWLNARRGGDNIDAGLSLLCELERAGYGVFEL